jgi:DNA-binding SARP family transcriptional activator
MGTKFNQREAPRGIFSKDQQTEWQMIARLFNEKQYEQTAQRLSKFQIPEHNHDSHLAPILETAHQICLVCQQIQAEIELHQQAYFEAVQREQELQQQLTLILDLVKQYWEPRDLPPVSNTEKQQPAVENGRSWWQRLRDMFEQKSSEVVESLVPDSVKTGGETAVFQTDISRTELIAPTKNGPSLVIYCFGPFRVYLDEKLLTNWNGLKGQSILKYLVTHKDKPIARDILIDVFWPEVESTSARRNLHQAIYSLRQTLRREVDNIQHVVFQNDCYFLNPEIDLWVDYVEFHKHVKIGRRFEATGNMSDAVTNYGIAEGLYQSEFLPEDLYEDWTQSHRERLHNQYLDITERLSKYYLAQENYSAALMYCRKILDHEKCHEMAHRWVMRCYSAQGQRYLALRCYQLCKEALQQELNLEPSPKTVALYEQIRSRKQPEDKVKTKK